MSDLVTFFSPERLVDIQTVSEPRPVWRRGYTRDEVREQINAACRESIGRGLQLVQERIHVEDGETHDYLTTCFASKDLCFFFETLLKD